MTTSTSTREDRLLVVGDLDRLGPIVRKCFAPNPISGVRGLLAGIAEIPRAPTRAILVGHDPSCRNVEAAVSALRRAAGDNVPVVYCCEPGYEHVGRRVIEHGADDYVIFPPESGDLERALRMAPAQTQRPEPAMSDDAPAPTAEQWARLIERARRAEHWRRLALTDDLTRLPNRRRLMSFLKAKIRWAADNRATLSVLIFDIDDFKRYNDRYGHDAGDEILADVGRMFVQCTRKHDMVARYGGDEFVVVFWDPKGPREAGSQHPQRVIDVLQRFRASLKSHRFTRLGPEAQGCLTISGGLAQYPWQAKTGPELLEAADHALLQAKEAGKNRFRIIGSADVADEDVGC